MLISHIGHAGFVVEYGENDKRILIDPWFGTAFLGAWRPYPDNSRMRAQIVSMRYDLVYVSHAHEDHFDKMFLDEVEFFDKAFRDEAESPKAICAPFMSDEMEERGFDIVTDPDCTIYTDDYRQDSMLLIDDDGFRALFANDMNLNADWPKADVLACQFSGASWYPHAYDYPPEVMARKVAEERARQMDMLVAKIEATGARIYHPCAGPARMDGVPIGPGTAFPLWAEIAEEFARRCPNVCVSPMFSADEWSVTVKRGNTTFTMPDWVSREIYSGRCTWEEALLSMRVKLHREPDVYDEAMMDELRGRSRKKDAAA